MVELILIHAKGDASSAASLLTAVPNTAIVVVREPEDAAIWSTELNETN